MIAKAAKNPSVFARSQTQLLSTSFVIGAIPYRIKSNRTDHKFTARKLTVGGVRVEATKNSSQTHHAYTKAIVVCNFSASSVVLLLPNTSILTESLVAATPILLFTSFVMPLNLLLLHLLSPESLDSPCY